MGHHAGRQLRQRTPPGWSRSTRGVRNRSPRPAPGARTHPSSAGIDRRRSRLPCFMSWRSTSVSLSEGDGRSMLRHRSCCRAPSQPTGFRARHLWIKLVFSILGWLASAPPLAEAKLGGTMEDRWKALAVLTVARTSLGFQVQSVGSISPVLLADLGLNFADLGALIGLYFLPGIALTIPAGMYGK